MTASDCSLQEDGMQSPVSSEKASIQLNARSTRDVGGGGMGSYNRSDQQQRSTIHSPVRPGGSGQGLGVRV